MSEDYHYSSPPLSSGSVHDDEKNFSRYETELHQDRLRLRHAEDDDDRIDRYSSQILDREHDLVHERQDVMGSGGDGG